MLLENIFNRQNHPISVFWRELRAQIGSEVEHYAAGLLGGAFHFNLRVAFLLLIKYSAFNAT